MHGTTSRVDPKVKEQSAIKARLLKAGITLSDIYRKYGLSDGTARNTMREPDTRCKCAIAPGLDTDSNAEATSKQPVCIDMDQNPFFLNLDPSRPIQPFVILIFWHADGTTGVGEIRLLFLQEQHYELLQ